MKHAREDYNRIQDPDGKIPEDEPVFLLRGQDMYAAQAVRHYAAMIEMEAPELAAMARAHADEMGRWHPQKPPDLPGPKKRSRKKKAASKK